jgi:23S rRNA (cytosine1962-C5)-methyltransferase
MNLSDYKDYQLIDSGDFRKLEQVGPYRFIRPSPQAVWSPVLPMEKWQGVDAEYKRFAGGDGKWYVANQEIKDAWVIEVEGLKLRIKMTDFGHLGIFPEQMINWRRLGQQVEAMVNHGVQPRVLNLFAYTGLATLACAQAGAEVVHIDASKTSVATGRENAELNGLADASIRWIIDDAQKFVAREVRRKNKYQGIILDPPSFGRGAKNEVWKIEEHMIPLLRQLKEILDYENYFVLLSSHSTGYTPVALKNLLNIEFDMEFPEILHEEMLVAHRDHGTELPSGASAWVCSHRYF